MKFDSLKQKAIELFGVDEDSVIVEERMLNVVGSGISIEFAIPDGLDLNLGFEIRVNFPYRDLFSYE